MKKKGNFSTDSFKQIMAETMTHALFTFTPSSVNNRQKDYTGLFFCPLTLTRPPLSCLLYCETPHCLLTFARLDTVHLTSVFELQSRSNSL